MLINVNIKKLLLEVTKTKEMKLTFLYQLLQTKLYFLLKMCF